MPAPFEVPARRAHPCSSVCAAPRLDAPPPQMAQRAAHIQPGRAIAAPPPSLLGCPLRSHFSLSHGARSVASDTLTRAAPQVSYLVDCCYTMRDDQLVLFAGGAEVQAAAANLPRRDARIAHAARGCRATSAAG